MEYIDLHIHTAFSDGSLSLTEIIDIAKRKGLKAIAITDHDTTGDIPEIPWGIEVIPGIELSASYLGKEIHVLGYFIDHNAPELKSALEWIVSQREKRNENIIERLARGGYPISIQELQSRYPDTVIGRPHIAAVLVEKGCVGSVRETFDNLIGRGGPYYQSRDLLTLGRAAEVIRKSGGAAVLAHPADYGMSDPELLDLTDAANTSGFLGLEVLHPNHSLKAQIFLKYLVDRYDMVSTGGSDFHGATKPDINIGCMNVPYYMLDELKQRRQDIK